MVGAGVTGQTIEPRWTGPGGPCLRDHHQGHWTAPGHSRWHQEGSVAGAWLCILVVSLSSCGMRDAASAWPDKRCHVCTQDLIPGPPQRSVPT